MTHLIVDWDDSIVHGNMAGFFQELFYKSFVPGEIGETPSGPVEFFERLKKGREFQENLDRQRRLEREGKLKREYRVLRDLYETYNREVIDGMPVSSLQETVSEYAERLWEEGRVEEGILKTAEKVKERGGFTAILSSADRNLIKETLSVGGYLDAFSEMVANDLKVESNEVKGFKLEILGNKDKYLKNLANRYNLDMANTVFVTDSYRDERCLEMVGRPVVSLLSKNDDYTGELAEKYGAKKLRRAEDLEEIVEIER